MTAKDIENAAHQESTEEVDPVVDRRKVKKPQKTKKGNSNNDAPRSRKSKFPTPSFNFFSVAINAIALFFSGFSLYAATDQFNDFDPLPINEGLFVLLAILSVSLVMYASGVKPTVENKQSRKILTALTLLLGTILIVAVALVSFL